MLLPYFCTNTIAMYQTLVTDLSNGIFTITINRPDKLNALNQQVMSDLNDVMDDYK